MMRPKYVSEIKSMTDAGFNAVEASEPIVNRLDNLCQLMFDPENQPPQISTAEAWNRFQDIASGI